MKTFLLIFVFMVTNFPSSAHADKAVKAKIGSPSINGALICQDYDTVQMMIHAYNAVTEADMEAKLIGQERYKAIHGKVPAAPNANKFGCMLVPVGSELDWNENWMPAIVTYKMHKGKLFKGVTDPSMIEPNNP